MCVCVRVFLLLCTHICAFALFHVAEVRIHDCFISGCLWVGLPVLLQRSGRNLTCLWVRNQPYKASSCCSQRTRWNISDSWLSLSSSVFLHFVILRISPNAKTDSPTALPASPSPPLPASATEYRWQIKLFVVETREVYVPRQWRVTKQIRTFWLSHLTMCYCVSSVFEHKPESKLYMFILSYGDKLAIVEEAGFFC